MQQLKQQVFEANMDLPRYGLGDLYLGVTLAPLIGSVGWW